MIDWQVLSHLAEILGAVFVVALGCSTAAIAQSKVITKTCESMARQPELTNDLRFTMIIGLALIESLAIYCLLIALILLFVKW